MKKLLLTISVLLIKVINLNAQTLVKDINPGSGVSAIDQLKPFNGKAVFTIDKQIWVSDGSDAGTYQITRNSPGYVDNTIVVHNNSIFYTNSTQLSNSELWKTDGTPSGTVLIKSLNECGGAGGTIGQLYLLANTVVNNKILFSVYDCYAPNKTHGREFWKSDGTKVGTEIVTNITQYNNDYNTNSYENERWGVEQLAIDDKYIYFKGTTVPDKDHLRQDIYRSDGTEAGTIRVANLNDQGVLNFLPTSTDFNRQATLNGDLIIPGSRPNQNESDALYKISPGKPIEVIRGNSFGQNIRFFNQKIGGLAFFVNSNSELWVTDGTSVGTNLLRKFTSLYINYNASILYKNQFYFVAYDNSTGAALWKTDGTVNGTQLVKSGIGPINDITISNGKLFIHASATQIWKSDGTTLGTSLEKDLNPILSGIDRLVDVNGVLFFIGYDNAHGGELWTYTPASVEKKVQHFHQLTTNDVFSSRRLLKTIPNTPSFTVCADGSSASIFKFIDGNIDYTTASVRSTTVSVVDVAIYGSFSVISQNSDSLVVRYTHPVDIPPTSVSASLQLDLYQTSAPNQIYSSTALQILRAPILMVHGLGSKGDGFTKMKNGFINSGYWSKDLIYLVDYESKNTAAFADNSTVVPNAIDELIKQLLNLSIATGKADIIGHSMGGILSRMYLQSLSYRNDLHKLVTLNTPHSGAQIANVGYDINPDFESVAVSLWYRIGLPMIWLSRSFAIRDLRVNSEAIYALNHTNLNRHMVPSHAMTTTNPYTGYPIQNGEVKLVDASIALALQIPGLFGINLDQVFGESTHDWVVSQTSQFGGLTGCVTTIPNHIHMGSMDDPRVIQTANDIFRQNVYSSTFCQDGFRPADLNPPASINSKKKSNEKARLTSGLLTISRPIRGSKVQGSKSMAIEVSSTDLEEAKLVINYKFDSTYVGIKNGNNAIFTFKTDTLSGRRDIVVYGRTASGQYLADSTYFYLSNKASDFSCSSLVSGSWTNATTWSCGHEPTSTDTVIINAGHIISIDAASARALKVIYKGGRLNFITTSSKLFLYSGD